MRPPPPPPGMQTPRRLRPAPQPALFDGGTCWRCWSCRQIVLTGRLAPGSACLHVCGCNAPNQLVIEAFAELRATA